MERRNLVGSAVAAGIMVGEAIQLWPLAGPTYSEALDITALTIEVENQAIDARTAGATTAGRAFVRCDDLYCVRGIGQADSSFANCIRLTLSYRHVDGASPERPMDADTICRRRPDVSIPNIRNGP